MPAEGAWYETEKVRFRQWFTPENWWLGTHCLLIRYLGMCTLSVHNWATLSLNKTL